MNRIRDWGELDRDAQRRGRAGARPYAAALNPLLNAFVEMVPPGETAGPLSGLPYAAKDMFRTPTRDPGCGFDSGVAFAIEGMSEPVARPPATRPPPLPSTPPPHH